APTETVEASAVPPTEETQVAAAPQSEPSGTSDPAEATSEPLSGAEPVAVVEELSSAMQEMVSGIVEESVLDKLENNILAASFKGSTLVLSVGYLVWALRGAALLASVAAAGMPIWARFDPLPVLAAKDRDRDKKRELDENGDPEKDDWHEQRIKRLLDPTKMNDSD
ncbi:MAG: hypothetical protein QNL90_01580, partial [Gammaproteobacteria bacterium]|nr:hypothetical protein [Gammaproteobacteria bacterium]MDX2458766.1 hypothetical protein [Gammaproteobacteria bacterium]